VIPVTDLSHEKFNWCPVTARRRCGLATVGSSLEKIRPGLRTTAIVAQPRSLDIVGHEPGQPTQAAKTLRGNVVAQYAEDHSVAGGLRQSRPSHLYPGPIDLIENVRLRTVRRLQAGKREQRGRFDVYVLMMRHAKGPNRFTHAARAKLLATKEEPAGRVDPMRRYTRANRFEPIRRPSRPPPLDRLPPNASCRAPTTQLRYCRNRDRRRCCETGP